MGALLMGRKNLFDASNVSKDPASPGSQRPTLPATGSMSPLAMLKNDRKNLIRDIRTDLIDDRPYSDRLSLDGPDMEDLVKSISEMGQTVPALVRPIPGDPPRFEIIYGRRRLEAARRLGRTLRAAIHDLDDREALRIQGTENNVRIEPSFIEKAVFAHQLAEDQWSRDLICETIAIHPSVLSKMLKIVSIVTLPTIQELGGCKEIARRPWESISDDLARLDLLGLPRPAIASHCETSQERFEAFRSDIDALLKDRDPHSADAAPDAAPETEDPPAPVSTPLKARRPLRVKIPFGRTGAASASIHQNMRNTILQFQKTSDTEGFDDWLKKNVETVLKDIQDKWMQDSAINPETPSKKGDADPMP